MPVNGVLEYLWFRDHDPWWATLLRAVTLIALVVLFAFKGMHKVPSGSKALRTRFNKVIHYRRDVYDRLGYTTHRRGEARSRWSGSSYRHPFRAQRHDRVGNRAIRAVAADGPAAAFA